MMWECSECGGSIVRHRPTLVCPLCGTASAPFVEAEPERPEPGDMRAYLIETGARRGVAKHRPVSLPTPLR